MYRRYSPTPSQKPRQPSMPVHNRPVNSQPLKGYPQKNRIQKMNSPVNQTVQNQQDIVKPLSQAQETKTNPLFKFIPTSVYNPDTQKVFGLLSAEDLLLAAMILLLLENNDSENQLLAYALLYVLISDYIDLPI